MNKAFRDEFEYRFESPFEVRGVYLDDELSDHQGKDASIYEYYKELMLASTDFRDMIDICHEFKFLWWGGHPAYYAILNMRSAEWYQTGNYTDYHKVILNLFDNIPAQQALTKEEMDIYIHFLLPHVMLKAKMIADRYELLEYYAALQYCRANWFGDDEDGMPIQN